MVVHTMQLIASDKKHIVIGLGKTGQSCVRYLLKQGAWVKWWIPRSATRVKRFESNILICQFGWELDADYLCSADDLVVSPGVPIKHPMIQRAMENGTDVTGDIDLFSCVAEAPIIAITGSNGKEYRLTLLGEMAKRRALRSR